MKKPVTVALLGAGMRGIYAYAPFSKIRPDLMKIVAAGDPNPDRLRILAERYNLPESACYSSAEEILAQGKLADVAIVCTQDQQHVHHVIPALQLGYDVILEKPAATNIEDCLAIARVARECGRKVAVSHVLRYTMFYQLIKFYIDSGRIGEVVSVRQMENVGWWHMAHSYVRGNWRRSEDSCPMILAKSCHDLDIIRWLVGKPCRRVSSFGSLKHFRPECAPPGATDRCLNGCGAKAGCQYDAEKIYAYMKYGLLESSDFSVVKAVTDIPTREALYDALRNGPYGRCVYHCDNDVVDHQVVNMEFEGGVTAAFTMCGFTQKEQRETYIYGTRGDIIGDMGEKKIYVTTFGQPTEVINVADYTSDFSGHGGGDNGLLREFLEYVRGDRPMSQTLTTLDTSIESHLMALLAEESRLHDGAVYELSNYTISV